MSRKFFADLRTFFIKKPGTVPEFLWGARQGLATRLGLQTGRARLGARLVFVGTVPEFLNAGEPVRRLAAAVSL